MSVRDLESELTRRKLEAMAEFAAGAGHEINNPLATIINRARQLLALETDPERRRWLETIGAQAYRIRDMLGDTMVFARPPVPKPEPMELLQEVVDVTSRFAEEFHRRGVSFFVPAVGSANAEYPLRVLADPSQLRIVISELVRNAMEAVPDGTGIITLSIEPQDATPRLVRLIIRDNGRGMTPADFEHMFDPFYSGRQAGRGLGFGLAKCWRIIQQHGGSIDIRPLSAGGVEAIVDWPAANSDP